MCGDKNKALRWQTFFYQSLGVHPCAAKNNKEHITKLLQT